MIAVIVKFNAMEGFCINMAEKDSSRISGRKFIILRAHTPFRDGAFTKKQGQEKPGNPGFSIHSDRLYH